MSEEFVPIDEQQLAEIAASFSYPPTPDIAGRVQKELQPRPARPRRTQRLAWATLVLLLFASALLAVPTVRAALLEFFKIGAIRIMPEPALIDEATAIPAVSTPGADHATAAAPVAPSATHLPTRTLLDLAGATTWEAAQAEAGFPLRYPPEHGLPDEVYRQEVWDPGLEAPVFIFVWRDEDSPSEVALALYQIPLPYYGLKGASLSAITETVVYEQRAYWVEGPHRLQLQTGEVAEWLFVPGNVLIWAEGEVTYRLEGADTVAEAVRIAESLAPRRDE